MQILAKNHVALFLIQIGIFMLAACSTTQSVLTPLPVEAPVTQSPTETVTTEKLVVTSPVPTETRIILPTETDFKATPTDAPKEEVADLVFSDVISVAFSGGENAYQFAVEIQSPDTGCEQYADWWEVITEDGGLIYRRILVHSHVTEQPFTRSGGPVAITADTVVIVRAHMYPAGYGGTAFQGSVEAGFEPIQIEPDLHRVWMKSIPCRLDVDFN